MKLFNNFKALKKVSLFIASYFIGPVIIIVAIQRITESPQAALLVALLYVLLYSYTKWILPVARMFGGAKDGGENELFFFNVDPIDFLLNFKNNIRNIKFQSDIYNMIYRMNKYVQVESDIGSFGDMLLDIIRRNYPDSKSAVLEMDEDGFLKIKRSRGLSLDFIKGARYRSGEGPAGRAYAEKQTVIIQDADKEGHTGVSEGFIREDIRSLVFIPVLLEGSVRFVLNVSSKNKKYFSDSILGELAKTARLCTAVLQRDKEFSSLLGKTKKMSEELTVMNEQLEQTNSRLIERIREMKLLIEISQSDLSEGLASAENSIVSTAKELFGTEEVRVLNIDLNIKNTLPVYDEYINELFQKRKLVFRPYYPVSNENYEYFSLLTKNNPFYLMPLSRTEEFIKILFVCECPEFVSGAERKSKIPSGLDKILTLVGRKLTDINSLEFYKNELISKNVQLINLDKMKDEFISLVSHELRTPLTAVKGYVNLIRDGDLGEISHSQQKYLGIVDENVDKLVSLIEQLLDMANINKMDKVPLFITRLDIFLVLDDVLLLFERKITEKKIAVEKIILGDQYIFSDQEKLKKILFEVIDNAVKFSNENGKITVRYLFLEGAAVFEISDTGAGIPEERLSRVFEYFYQGPAVLTRDRGGLGIGLSIAKSFVHAFGGSIDLRSAAGEGTTVKIKIPRQVNDI